MYQKVCNIFLGTLFLLFFGSCATQSYLYMEDPDTLYNRAMELYEQEKWGRASRYFEAVARSYVNTAREDTVLFLNARSRFKGGDYASTIVYLEGYRYQFSRSPFIEDAEGMLVLSYYYTSPRAERDPTNIYQTLSIIDEFKSRYPNSKSIEAFNEIKAELIQRLHDRSYLNAYTYYKTGHYKSAITAFRNALKEYPETNNRENIMYYMVLSGYELAKNSIVSLEVDRYMAVIDMYYSFIAEFPESQYRKELDRILEQAKAFLDKNDTKLEN